MDSGEDISTFVPPFELFLTDLGSGPADNRVSTIAIGIKTKASHHNLLRELFARLFTQPPSDLAHVQYSLCGIATIIGHSEYQNLLRENNKFFSTLATIPISGIDDSTLGSKIAVSVAQDNNAKKTLPEIFQEQAWCLQVEPTQTPGRILLVTTKAQVSAGCKWLDDNLEALFKQLPSNSQLQQSTIIPTRLDKIPTSDSMMNYAKALCHSIPSLPSDPNKDKKFSRKPVPYQPFRLIYNQQEFPALPSVNSRTDSNSKPPTPCNSNISTVGSFSSDEQHSPLTQTSTISAPTVDFAALKAEIKQEIKNSLLEEFNAVLRQEIAAMHSELQSFMSASHQQPSTEKLSDPKTLFNAVIIIILFRIMTQKLPGTEIYVEKT